MEYAQKLFSTRRGSLYLAAIAALLAGVVILVYLNQYRDELQSGGTPVTVLVARSAIPKGTSGDVIASKGLYTATTIRESQLREGAISDIASLRGKNATQEIYEGAQLTAAEFSSGVGSISSTLTERERVVAVPLDSAHGLTGELGEGDRVDVYAGFNVIPITPDGRPTNGGQARPILRLIMTNIPVVKVDEGDGSVASSSDKTDVSLRVDDQEAAKLTFASDNGKIWLSLRPSVGAKASRPSVVTLETLLLGIPPVTAVRSLGGRK
jgi:Flp pilus assembly protein CpaB